MGRGLDHVVHVVRDLDAAGAFYARLGFTVGARNRHPWGTHNRIVQFRGFFLEILTVAEPALIQPSTKSTASFGAFNRNFLAEAGEGLSGLVLEGRDPAAEKTAFDEAGFGGFDLLNFSRTGKRADGSETEVGFSIAFARDPMSPQTVFFTCKQTHPENFWSFELQQHWNGTRAISAAVLVAENPSDHHVFLQAFAGVRDVQATSRGITIATERGTIFVLDPRAFEDTFGVPAPRAEGLRVAALSFSVPDVEKLATLFEQNGVPFNRHRGNVVVCPFGAVLAFE